MRQTIHYNVIGHKKYKKIEIVPVFDTSGYNIYIDGKIRYGSMIFTKLEIDEKLQYWRQNMKIENLTINQSETKRNKSDEDLFLEKQAVTVDEMRKVMEEVLPPIKRGRGRPKGSRNKTKS